MKTLPLSKGRSLRGRQVIEYLRGQTNETGIGSDEGNGDNSQTHLHRGSGGNDPSNGAGGSDSGDELLETGAEG